MSTGIQWTDETWNPVVGCTQVSPGCAHCYAKELHDKRNKAYWAGKKVAPQYAQPFETVQLVPSRLAEPLRWRKPRRVFVNSVADLFHEAVPDEFIDRVFAVMTLAEWHTFQILTKRPARMLAYMTERWQPVVEGPDPGRDRHARVHRAVEELVYGSGIEQFGGKRWWTAEGGLRATVQAWPLPNVWLGVSVENQRWADERIPLLLQTPAAVRFLSCEPLLGPLELEPFVRGWSAGVTSRAEHHPNCDGDVCDIHCPIEVQEQWQEPAPRIDWVICGGESGKGARPCNVHDLTDVVAQCDFAGVPCFLKQMGSVPVTPDLTHWRCGYELLPDASGYALQLRDSHGGDPAEWPEELRVREFPTSGVRA